RPRSWPPARAFRSFPVLHPWLPPQNHVVKKPATLPPALGITHGVFYDRRQLLAGYREALGAAALRRLRRSARRHRTPSALRRRRGDPVLFPRHHQFANVLIAQQLLPPQQVRDQGDRGEVLDRLHFHVGLQQIAAVG